MSIVAGEMRDPEKNVPRAILGSISIVSVLYMLIIAGTIAMLGGRILQTDASVQDAFVEMIGPVGAWIVLSEPLFLLPASTSVNPSWYRVLEQLLPMKVCCLKNC